MRYAFLGSNNDSGSEEVNLFDSSKFSFTEADSEMKTMNYKEYFFVGEYEDNDMPKNDIDLLKHANKVGWFDD